MLLSARTFDELHERLPDIDVVVPPRPAPRRDAAERYSMVRLLASLALALGDFPLRLTKSERPDFALQLGDRTVGVEHTEAVPTNVAHAGALRASLGRTTYLIWSAAVDEPRKSREQLLVEIKSDQMPPPMIGDSVERGWAEAMGRFVGEKVASARKPGYAAYDENWLVIYDNWPAPGLQRQLAIKILLETHLEAAAFMVFQRVFILDETVLVELRSDGALLHRVNHCRRA